MNIFESPFAKKENDKQKENIWKNVENIARYIISSAGKNFVEYNRIIIKLDRMMKIEIRGAIIIKPISNWLFIVALNIEISLFTEHNRG